MFKKLTDFSYKRNWKEAIGFYLANFVLALILGQIVAQATVAQTGAKTFEEGFAIGLKTGAMIAIIYCLALAVVILIKRKLYKNFGYIVLALLSGLVAVYGGALFGLIIPAIMTTLSLSPQAAKQGN
jgi:hypothetical protein